MAQYGVNLDNMIGLVNVEMDTVRKEIDEGKSYVSIFQGVN
jgi:hypothetical protein